MSPPSFSGVDAGIADGIAVADIANKYYQNQNRYFNQTQADDENPIELILQKLYF